MTTKLKVGIAGLGMVGTPLYKYLLESGFVRGKSLFCFDIAKKEYTDDLNSTNIIFICVPTPIAKNGFCDTSYVESVVKKYDSKNKIFVIKSTVEPGTTEKLNKKYRSTIIFSPEFLREKNAWNDFINPDRQIVAHKKNSVHAKKVIKILPKSKFVNIHSIHSTEAELGKYASNVFGALKVVYSNIIADFAKTMGADYENVRKVFTSDKRIGDSWTNVFYHNYRGFGGYCFPKDTDALISLGKKLGIRGVAVFRAMKKYNEDFLRSQGLSSKIVSSHDKELKRILKDEVKKI